MSVYVGTSGWDYPEWRGHFYPEDLPKSRFLEHYSGVFNACELNATFYGRQTERSVARWDKATPQDFRFCAKAHMRMTHVKQFVPDDDARSFMTEFMGTLSGLGKKLAAVLVQFPKFIVRDDEALRRYIQALPPSAGYVFEFRDESWDEREVAQLIASAGGSVCLSDETGAPPDTLGPGPLGYVRLRATRYEEEQIRAWLELLERESRERDVFVFARHKGIDPAEPRGGVSLARRLARELV